MFRLMGSRRMSATVVCMLLNTGKTRCTKDDDKKTPVKDFSSFLNQFGENKSGDIFERVKEAAGNLSGNKEIDFSSLLDSANVRKVFESGTPGEIGYGFMMGYCSGFCVKKVSKIVALGVGGVFIGLQALSYNGFISIDYDKVQKTVEGELDLNNDGKVGTDDLKIAYDKLTQVLSFHMPTGGGFSAGFLMGVRS